MCGEWEGRGSRNPSSGTMKGFMTLFDLDSLLQPQGQPEGCSQFSFFYFLHLISVTVLPTLISVSEPSAKELFSVSSQPLLEFTASGGTLSHPVMGQQILPNFIEDGIFISFSFCYFGMDREQRLVYSTVLEHSSFFLSFLFF